MRKINIVKAALVLTIASFITRILGFGYRIYMTKAMGAEVVGLYQLIMPIYNLTWSISASGFSTTISRLIASENAKREYGNKKVILYRALFISIIISTIVGLMLFIFADFLAINIVKESRIVFPLKILSFAIPFMSAGSCIRGYFHGTQKSSIPAISQVMEQSIRIFVVFFLANNMLDKGEVYATISAVIGILLGEVLSFVYVYYEYIKKRRRTSKKASIGRRESYKQILSMAVPLTANRVSASLLSTVENILIPQMLLLYGMTRTASIEIYGQVMGMAIPLIQFPAALLLSLSTSLVPAVAESIAVKDYKSIKETSRQALKFTSVVGVAAAILFIVFPKEISHLIYQDDSIAKTLLQLAFICPLLYLHITFAGLLNGLGEQMLIFKSSLISSGINILLIYFFMPIYGMNAFIIAWAICLMFSLTISARRVKKRTELEFDYLNLLIKPISAGIFAASIVYFIKLNLLFVSKTLAGMFALTLLMYALYLLYLIFTKCILMENITLIFEGFKKNRKTS